MDRVARRGRLPDPLTSLIGREADIREVERRLGEHRLVTLTGAGGSGKTRLAIAVASRSSAEDVTFVALEDAHDITAVVVGVADALAITERPGTDLVATVESYLADRRLLLVLDNFEQVLAAAPLVSGFLEAASGIRVLVTSRAPLRIAGEQEWEVQPLDAEFGVPVLSSARPQCVPRSMPPHIRPRSTQSSASWTACRWPWSSRHRRSATSRPR